MFDQLQIMADRYEELGGLLSDPEVVNDTKRFMALSKEEASLRETVAAYARYVEVTTGISDAEEMLSDSSLDADESDMFKEELKALKAEKVTLEEDIKILLLPKDPNDDKNIILEIRGAAGGDEAALFAGDLLNMYQKYSENQGWKFEILESNVTEIGGIKEVSVMISGNSVYSKLKYESARIVSNVYQKQRLRGVSIPQQQRYLSCLKSKISTSTLTRKICVSIFIMLQVPADRTSTKLRQLFGLSMNQRVSRLRCRKNGISKKTEIKL
jgi:hypothetical protein